MDLAENFNKIGFFNVGIIKNRLAKLDESAWTEHDLRQQRYQAHRYTQTIPLLYDSDFRFSTPTKHGYYNTLENEIKTLLDIVAEAYIHKGYPLRLLLTRLTPRSAIKPHKDKGLALRWVHRIHIPIQTNSQVSFIVGNERLLLKEGEIWEINNCRVHSVHNKSLEFRIHLILDWVTTDLAQAYLQQRFTKNGNSKLTSHSY